MECADAGELRFVSIRPAMAPLLEKIAAAYGTAEFERVFAEVYPQCENISIDYAVLEPRSAKGEAGAEIYCLPGDFEWNDLGSWSALHEHVAHARRRRFRLRMCLRARIRFASRSIRLGTMFMLRVR